MKAILTFHSIDNTGSVISYPLKSFSALLEKLYRADIPILSLDELLNENTESGVALTFDDGMYSVYQNAFPIMRDYSVCAHVFVTTKAIEDRKTWPSGSGVIPGFQMMGWDELCKLHDIGIFIDAHTHTHPDMRTLSTEQITEDCNMADQLIHSRIGRMPRYFAYPFGYHDQKTRDVVREIYDASVTTELKPLSGKLDYAALPRLDSYYFRTPKSIDKLDSFMMNAYLKARNYLRNLKGSQCKANAN